MIKVISGDLLESDCTIIGHQANCMSRMKSGIARQISETYPEVPLVDKKFPYPPSERLGKVSYWTNGYIYVFNLYGQFMYGRGKRQTNYDALENAMRLMLEEVKAIEKNNSDFRAKIGFPYLMGAGLGGGNWEEIYSRIEKVFVEEANRDVYLYKLEV